MSKLQSSEVEYKSQMKIERCNLFATFPDFFHQLPKVSSFNELKCFYIYKYVEILWDFSNVYMATGKISKKGGKKYWFHLFILKQIPKCHKIKLNQKKKKSNLNFIWMKKKKCQTYTESPETECRSEIRKRK